MTKRNGFDALGAAANWLAFAAALAVGFFLTPYLIAALGKPRYDAWCVVESVLAYFTLLDFGVAACLVRFVARHATNRDDHSLNRIATCCLAVFLIAGILAALVGTPVLLGLSETLKAKAGGSTDVLPFMLLMLANLACTLPLSVFPSLLDGLEKFTAKSLVRVVFLLARTGGILAVVDGESGLLPLGIVTTVSNLLEHAVLAGLCFRYLPGLSFSPRFLDRATLKQVRGYSSDAFLAMLAGRITVQTGAIVVGLLLPPGSVTFFATAARLVEYAKTLLRTITTTLTPGVSAREALGDFDGIRKLFRNATRLLLYMVLPINLGLWFFGRPFLVRWVGPEFGEGSFPAVAILAGSLSLGVVQSVASRILYGLGRLRLFARMALAEAALNLVLTLALVKPFGIEGVAVAVTLPNVLFSGAVILFTTRTLKVSARDSAGTWVRPLIANGIPVLIWSLLGEPQATWWGIGTAIAFGLFPYVIVAGALEFRGKWKRFMRPAIRSFRPARSA